MAPHTTFREFLNTVTPRLPAAIEPFTKLTTMVENVLYSAREPDKNTAARAELLANIIKEELHGATA